MSSKILQEINKIDFAKVDRTLSQSYMARIDLESTFLIYDSVLNKVGTLKHYIARFGNAATVRVSMKDTIVFGTIDEYMAYILDLANGAYSSISVEEYAARHRLRKTDVRRFCLTPYAYALGVRLLTARNRSVYAIPDALKPDYWKELRNLHRHRSIALEVLDVLGDKPVLMGALFRKLSPPHREEVLRKIISRMAKNGLIIKEGRGPKALISLPIQ